MSFLFSKKFDAIKYASDTHTYAILYEENKASDTEIPLHDLCVAVFCISGSASCLYDNKVFELNLGEVSVFSELKIHKINPKSADFSSFVMYVHPEFLKSCSTNLTDLTDCFYKSENNIINLSDAELKTFQELFLVFRSDLGFGDDILKTNAVSKALVLLNSCSKKNTAIPTTQESGTFFEILKYIDTNIHSDLNLETIANAFCISQNQVCKLFQKHLGTTFLKYILAKRVTHAKKHLKMGKGVNETANLCGFSDYANFIRVFKKLVGIPPKKYAKLQV